MSSQDVDVIASYLAGLYDGSTRTPGWRQVISAAARCLGERSEMATPSRNRVLCRTLELVQ